MVRIHCRMIAVALCCTMASCSDGTPDESAGDSQPIAESLTAANPSSAELSENPVDASPMIDGLWSGTWGGGSPNTRGIVFQPVISQLFIEGDHVELSNFHQWRKLDGTVRFDNSSRKMLLITTTTERDPTTPKVISFAYDIQGDRLTLTGLDGHAVSFTRIRAAQLPQANVQVEFVEAAGITDTGDLLVNTFTQLRAGRTGSTYFRPTRRSLKTNQATVRLLEESGWKNVAVAEAGKRIRKSMPVVIAYRDDERPSPVQSSELWVETGPPPPDSEAVWHTLSSILRPGTLVFVLSSRENVPQP